MFEFLKEDFLNKRRQYSLTFQEQIKLRDRKLIEDICEFWKGPGGSTTIKQLLWDLLKAGFTPEQASEFGKQMVKYHPIYRGEYEECCKAFDRFTGKIKPCVVLRDTEKPSHYAQSYEDSLKEKRKTPL